MQRNDRLQEQADEMLVETQVKPKNSLQRWAAAFKAYGNDPNGRDANGTYLAVVERRAAKKVHGDIVTYGLWFTDEPQMESFQRLYPIEVDGRGRIIIG